jgi:hypothetical protein
MGRLHRRIQELPTQEDGYDGSGLVYYECMKMNKSSGRCYYNSGSNIYEV